MLRILLTGAAGQLGRELQPRLEGLGQVIAIDQVAPAPGAGHIKLDLADEVAMASLLEREQPGLLVNAAAYTAVDQAENVPELAFRVNAGVPGFMARWAAEHDAAMLHYSTDYVFDGSADRLYVESDPPAPLNVYGESKLAGEVAIAESGCRHLVMRSSWIYSSHGNNFVLKMLELAGQRPELLVVDDQVGCPTWAGNLADYSLAAIGKGLVGNERLGTNLLHSADRDHCSWFDFADRVFETALSLGLLESKPKMQRVNSKQFSQLARRPAWSALDSSGLQRSLGLESRGLDESLAACMQELVCHE